MNEPIRSRHVFVTGATGFMGRALIAALLPRGHQLCALVRKGSEGKLPPGCTAVVGNALEKGSYAGQVAPADTFVQLVGVTHPNPAKANEFRQVDLASGRAAVAAAVEAGIQHFVYVSAAQPAPVMKAYVAVRTECEQMIRASGAETISFDKKRKPKQNPMQFGSSGTLTSGKGCSDARCRARDSLLVCNRISGGMGGFQAIIEATTEKS